MSKHTAGPWSIGTIERIKGGGFEAWIDGQNHGCIAQVVVAMEGEEENENPTLMGNARLISAAPELLDALRDMLSGWRYIRETHGDLYGVGWDRAEAKAVSAITRAIGEKL